MDFGLVGIGIAAFIATNIDDLFVLMAFFAARQYPAFHVVLWQYLGIGTLIAISILASLIALVIPSNYVGLLGFLPIAIGIKELLELKKRKENTDGQLPKGKSALSFSAVAIVAIADGGDNIGIYTPLFATYNGIGELVTIITVFMAMTAVWCGLAYYFVYHSFLAKQIHRVGRIALPFVLIGLGIYILAEAFLFL